MPGMEKYWPGKKCVVMSRDEVRAVDAWAIDEIGVPGVVLMENAGRTCAELIAEKLDTAKGRKVCILCGTGNNGGDGYVIARHLLNSRFEVLVAICGDREKITGDAKVNLDVLEKTGRAVEAVDPKSEQAAGRVKRLCQGADMIVDALFGTGLAGKLRAGYERIIEAVNEQNCPVAAVDIPSGLDCDTGLPLGTAIRADYTVTFVAAKKGFARAEAGAYTGEIYVASIGIEPQSSASA
ncbi:MAG: NAD(P)H-hydrate epimerase [Sedimentisphaerales bacterium]|nr:NAD(P)H-hydrate epimerase [Sedimentisphaerales bacterium]